MNKSAENFYYKQDKKTIFKEKISVGNLNFNKMNFKSTPFLLLALAFIFSIFSLNFISADVISINSGGSEQIIINPDSYIEGFFTGDIYVAVCGNGIVDTGETCDDGNVVSGDGCSSSCIIEVVTPPGGGGGGGGAVTETQNLAVSPTSFTITLAVNTNQQQTITITNLGASATTITLSKSMFDSNSKPVDMILMNTTSFILQPRQTKQILITFVAGNDTGIFTGNIRIGNFQIPVSINVKTKLLLFDSNIVVLNKDYKVAKGDVLKTRVNLIPLGEKERLDVTLDYTIRDYTGKVYITKKETLLVEDRINFDRNFDTGSLPLGKYVIGLELKYPGGVAPSSAHFEVVSKTPVTFGTIVLWLIVMIIIIAIIIIIIIIYRRRKRKEERMQ